MSASARMRRLPSIAREIGSWTITISARVDEEEHADLALAHMRVVACERRHEVEERVARGDEEEVQRPQADEEPVAQDCAVRRRSVDAVLLGDARVVDEEEHADVGEERRRVDEEENREGRRDARRSRSARR